MHQMPFHEGGPDDNVREPGNGESFLGLVRGPQMALQTNRNSDELRRSEDNNSTERKSSEYFHS